MAAGCPTWAGNEHSSPQADIQGDGQRLGTRETQADLVDQGFEPRPSAQAFEHRVDRKEAERPRLDRALEPGQGGIAFTESGVDAGHVDRHDVARTRQELGQRRTRRLRSSAQRQSDGNVGHHAEHLMPRLLEFLDGAVDLAELQQCPPQEGPRHPEVGVHGQGQRQLGDRLAVVAGEIERHADVAVVVHSQGLNGLDGALREWRPPDRPRTSG